MVTGADERPARHIREAEPARQAAELVELVRGEIADDREMLGGWLEVLAERQVIAADRPQVGHRLDDLLGRLAQAEHQPALGECFGPGPLGMRQDRQAHVVSTLPAHLLLEASHGLDVVIEDLGAGRQHAVDPLGPPVEVGSEYLDRCPGPPPDGLNAAGEVLRAAVGQVVARDRGDHDVPQA